MSDKVNQKSTFPSTGKLTSQAVVCPEIPFKKDASVFFRQLVVRADTSCGLQEDKLVAVSSVVVPPQLAGRQNVGGGTTVTALTFKSVILTVTLYEGEERVPLL